jgi:putative methionine-R-sulfoxide reductase with GAF domain
MFKNIKNNIDTLNKKREYLDANWDIAESKSLLKFYINITPKLLNAERCSIFIHDRANKEVWLKCGTGLSEKQIRVSATDSVVGEVISTGKYKIVTDMDHKEGVHKQVDKETGFVSRNIICVPIKTLDGTEVSGAIQVLNKLDDTDFDDDDRELLDKMAHFLQLTIENFYFNQEVTGVLTKIFNLLIIVTTIFVTIMIFLIITAIVYWFMDYLFV